MPESAERASDIRSRWGWVEPSVWTDRMLEALENGIKGVKETKWFCLTDKVASPANLMSAYLNVAENNGAAGVDHVTVDRFAKNCTGHIEKMSAQLMSGDYHPSLIKRTFIAKPGKSERRPLGIPTVRDRIAQTALRHVIEPIFELGFAEHSYGFRPGRGCKDALRRVHHLLKSGRGYVVDADIRRCFECIPHNPLLRRIEERVADRNVLELIRRFLKQRVMLEETEELEYGTPQGGALSPLLCNIYLNPLDHLMKEHGFELVRYADDLVIVCDSAEEAEEALDTLKAWLQENGLSLHPEKTRIVDMRLRGNYFDFLGYRFRHTQRDRLVHFPSPASEKKLRERLRRPTRRSNGHCMAEIIKRCNRILRGWFEYFKHGLKWMGRQIDGWVRMRLRSILRQWNKRKGRGRGLDHQRWPNRYFANLGLFSIQAAYDEACSPRRG